MSNKGNLRKRYDVFRVGTSLAARQALGLKKSRKNVVVYVNKKS